MTDHWTTPLREPATRPGAKPTSRFVPAPARSPPSWREIDREP